MKKLKLDQLVNLDLKKKEMHNIRGGSCAPTPNACGCGCMYSGSGSSSYDNNRANRSLGISTQ